MNNPQTVTIAVELALTPETSHEVFDSARRALADALPADTILGAHAYTDLPITEITRLHEQRQGEETEEEQQQ